MGTGTVPQFLFDFINSVSIIKFLPETRVREMRKNYSRGAVLVIPIIFPSLGMKNGIRVPRQEATLCSQLQDSRYKYWTLVTFLASKVFMTIRVLYYQIDSKGLIEKLTLSLLLMLHTCMMLPSYQVSCILRLTQPQTGHTGCQTCLMDLASRGETV